MYTEQAFCTVTAKINFTLTNPVSRVHVFTWQLPGVLCSRHMW